MLNLYYKPLCPYCQRVLKTCSELSIELFLLDVSVDIAARADLLEKGGKRQVPFLHDTEKNVCMYESIDIIEYLRVNYSNGKDSSQKEVGNVYPIG